MWNYHTIDPSQLESRYSNEDAISNLDGFLDDLGEDEEVLLDRVKKILHLLPPREADFIDLYFFKKFKQTDIAKLFDVSQPTICYRLTRAAARIRFLLSLPVVTQQNFEKELPLFFDDILDRKVMVLMYHSTCQSEVAKEVGVSQGLVRHRFLRSIRKLEKMTYGTLGNLSPQKKIIAEKYRQIFQSIADNLNIMREVTNRHVDDNTFYILL